MASFTLAIEQTTNAIIADIFDQFGVGCSYPASQRRSDHGWAHIHYVSMVEFWKYIVPEGGNINRPEVRRFYIGVSQELTLTLVIRNRPATYVDLQDPRSLEIVYEEIERYLA